MLSLNQEGLSVHFVTQFLYIIFVKHFFPIPLKGHLMEGESEEKLITSGNDIVFKLQKQLKKDEVYSFEYAYFYFDEN